MRFVGPRRLVIMARTVRVNYAHHYGIFDRCGTLTRDSPPGSPLAPSPPQSASPDTTAEEVVISPPSRPPSPPPRTQQSRHHMTTAPAKRKGNIPKVKGKIKDLPAYLKEVVEMDKETYNFFRVYCVLLNDTRANLDPLLLACCVRCLWACQTPGDLERSVS